MIRANVGSYSSQVDDLTVTACSWHFEGTISLILGRSDAQSRSGCARRFATSLPVFPSRVFVWSSPMGPRGCSTAAAVTRSARSPASPQGARLSGSLAGGDRHDPLEPRTPGSRRRPNRETDGSALYPTPRWSLLPHPRAGVFAAPALSERKARPHLRQQPLPLCQGTVKREFHCR